MGEWSRSNPWRQGSIIRDKTFEALRLKGLDGVSEHVAIVISHDCDIAAAIDREPVVEVIVGRFIEAVQGGFANAKQARRLHLYALQADGGKRSVEIFATAKDNVSKNLLADFGPSTDFHLSISEVGVLRRWLAARYRRHAFPDAFEDRFNKVKDRFLKALKGSSNHIRAVLFDLDEEQVVDAANLDDPYVLDIYLLYTSEPNSHESLRVANATKALLLDAFRKTYASQGVWKSIELRLCDVISDQALTYAQYLMFKEWRTEEMSLSSDPPGPMTEEADDK